MARSAKDWRDDARLLLGAAGLIHETVIDAHPEPSLILVFAGLIGIAVPGVVERSKKRDGE